MKNLIFTLIFLLSGYVVNAESYNITLSVDVSPFDGTVSLVKVNGGFSSWTAYELTNTSGSIWEVTVPMNEGDTDYRFEIIDSEDGWHPEWPDNNASGSCFVNGNMRKITVSKDSVMETVCWEKCASCSTEEPTSAEITVSINMSSYTGPGFTNVMMNGGFKGWGDAIGLTTDNDSLVWTTTVTMNMGINDYRFEVGGGEVGWDSEWEGEGGANSIGDCFINLYDNTQSNMRWITVTKDSVLSTVCWESCSTCTSTQLPGNNQKNIDVLFNNSNELIITGLNKTEEPLTVRIIDLKGSQIRIFKNIQVNNNTVSLNGINSGIYIVNMYNNSIFANKKIIKQ